MDVNTLLVIIKVSHVCILFGEYLVEVYDISEMGKIFNVSLAVFAGAGSFLFGYDSGVMTDVSQSSLRCFGFSHGRDRLLRPRTS